MYEEITLDVSELYQAQVSVKARGKNYTPRGIKEISVPNGYYGSRFTIKIVEDENARFINLFGVFVDIESGNIALGYFPDKYEYILIDNLYSQINKIWFGSVKPKNVTVDYKYIIQLLKLDPEFYKSEIYDEISDSFTKVGNFTSTESKSLMVAFAKNLFEMSASVCDEKKRFSEKYSNDTFLTEIYDYCISLNRKLETLAKSYYGNFITEQEQSDIDALKGKKLAEVMFGNLPNMETLTQRYLEIGLPLSYLNALSSYGFKVKSKNALYTTKKSFDASNIVKNLSSMCYDLGQNQETLLAYNFMDLIYETEWCQNIVFAVEFFKEYSSVAILDKILRKFHIYEILKEQNLSEKSFVIGLDNYIREFLPKRDCSTVYERLPNPNQYAFLSNSSQLSNAGKVLNSTVLMLNKCFSEVQR